MKGWFATWRWVFVWFTQLLFYGLPWPQWGGRQAVLFDLEAQRFFIFGLLLYPQDLIFLAAPLVLSALALFFFTAVAGRLWCGYTCPQTVYTEIFTWAERKIEGDRIARMRLDQAPWGLNKVLRKGTKHRIAAGGIDGMEVLSTPASAGPAAVTAMSVSLRLPYAAAQALAWRSVPVFFEVTGVQQGQAQGAQRSATQLEKSMFFVPR